jgi:hypothetical protein
VDGIIQGTTAVKSIHLKDDDSITANGICHITRLLLHQQQPQQQQQQQFSLKELNLDTENDVLFDKYTTLLHCSSKFRSENLAM